MQRTRWNSWTSIQDWQAREHWVQFWHQQLQIKCAGVNFVAVFGHGPWGWVALTQPFAWAPTAFGRRKFCGATQTSGISIAWSRVSVTLNSLLIFCRKKSSYWSKLLQFWGLVQPKPLGVCSACPPHFCLSVTGTDRQIPRKEKLCWRWIRTIRFFIYQTAKLCARLSFHPGAWECWIWGGSHYRNYLRCSFSLWVQKCDCSLQQQLVFLLPPSFLLFTWKQTQMCLKHLIINISWNLYDCVSCTFLFSTGFIQNKKKGHYLEFCIWRKFHLFSHGAGLGFSAWPGHMGITSALGPGQLHPGCTSRGHSESLEPEALLLVPDLWFGVVHQLLQYSALSLSFWYPGPHH